MTTIELFLKLVRNALWQTEEELPEELSANMAVNIIRGCREQALAGLVIDALIRNKVKVPEEQYLEMMVMLMKVKMSNEQVNEGLRRLKELFDERQIEYVVVKGQAVATYYTTPALRQAGDIDYYCDEQNYPLAQEAVREAWGIEADANGSFRHINYDYQGVTYEQHFMLTNFFGKKQDRYWQELVDGAEEWHVSIDGMAVRTLPPTIHALFIFVHLYDHLLNLGVGFRQFCDLAVMLHYCYKDIDHERMREVLKRLGMERAYRAVGCILTDSLGMPEKDLGCQLTEHDRRFARRIYGIVRYRGNLGHYNIRNMDSGWRNNIEMKGIKLSHFFKLFLMAPSYNCRWFRHMIRKKLPKYVVVDK